MAHVSWWGLWTSCRDIGGAEEFRAAETAEEMETDAEEADKTATKAEETIEKSIESILIAMLHFCF